MKCRVDWSVGWSDIFSPGYTRVNFSLRSDRAVTQIDAVVELRSFRPKSVSPQVVSPQLRVVSPLLKVVSAQLKVVSPRPKQTKHCLDPFPSYEEHCH